jgi:hypothetical protein
MRGAGSEDEGYKPLEEYHSSRTASSFIHDRNGGVLHIEGRAVLLNPVSQSSLRMNEIIFIYLTTNWLD